MQAWQQEWDEFNQVAAEPRQQAEVQQSRIQHLEQALQRIQNRVANLEQEQKGLSAGPADVEVARLGDQMAVHEYNIAAHQARTEQLLGQVNSAREQRNDLAAQLDRVRGELQGMRGRHASLETLQQAANGGDGAVQTWLQAQKLDSKPRLLEQLQVDSDWQLAVETVLGDYLQAVCVDGIEALGDALAQPPQGSLLLVERGAAIESAPGRLAGKVRGEHSLKGLLGTVIVADDLAQALQLRAPTRR